MNMNGNEQHEDRDEIAGSLDRLRQRILRTPEDVEAVRERRQALQQRAISLRAIRELNNLTQTELAKKLETSQSQLSKTESRDELLISSVRRYVEACGGRFEAYAVLEGVHYQISKFSSVASELDEVPKTDTSTGFLGWNWHGLQSPLSAKDDEASVAVSDWIAGLAGNEYRASASYVANDSDASPADDSNAQVYSSAA